MASNNVQLIGSDQHVDLQALEALADRRIKRMEMTSRATRQLVHSHELLQKLIQQRALVYGVTTGFGPLADRQIQPELGPKLQRNLVYHLASGVGPLLDEKESRAIFAARLICLAQGSSGVSPKTMRRLLRYFSRGIAPAIPSLGSVGASGDLTPLAHVALCLMGEGHAHTEGGLVHSSELLSSMGLDALTLEDREGLAIVNGTSAMTGLAACSGAEFERALELSIRLSVMALEVLGGHLEAWHPGLSQIRRHPGQAWAHQALNLAVAGSGRVKHMETYIPLEEGGEIHHMAQLPQDPYTLRCAPQILGALKDQAIYHNEVVARELNAVTDNPVFLPALTHAIHGGNFFGQHVAFASDALKNAVVSLMVWSERKIARLVDPALHQNQNLPPFMQAQDVGLSSGFMGAQVTASALVAWARGQATPASIQSIPTNANNQDVVSMGTLAAYQTRQVLARMWEVLAIEAMVLAQGVDILRAQSQTPSFSTSTSEMVSWLREQTPTLTEDRPLSQEIKTLAMRLKKVPQ